jgi:hypothetical protein
MTMPDVEESALDPYSSFILAGSHEEYRHYLEENGLDRNKHLYPPRPRDLRGVRAYDFAVVGTFYEKKWPMRMRMIKMAERNIISKNKKPAG